MRARSRIIKPSVILISVIASVVETAQVQAQIAPATQETETIVVTATRSERSLSSVGSTVNVISREKIESSFEKSVIGLFDQIPGMYATDSGGLGSGTSVRLRGADSDQTLVLIDGIRVNDPSSASGDFDFASLLVTDIERIEVVKGPQSTVWGSDAIGGVINIITRKGGEPRTTLTAEAGSFNTTRLGASLGGGTTSSQYSLSASFIETDGFSRLDENLGATETDAARILTLTGNYSKQLSDNYTLEVTGHFSDSDADTDPSLSNLSGDGEASSARRVHSLQLNNLFSAMNGLLENRISLFTSGTDREFLVPRNTHALSSFEGHSKGIEYQGDLSLSDSTSLLFGARSQTEQGRSVKHGQSTNILEYDASQDTHSLFAQVELQPIDDLYLTLGGRFDNFEVGGEAGTYRVTVAREFPDLGTTLRGSYGTGIKQPTIYQAHFSGPDPIFGGTLVGNQNLKAEESQGFDLGISQTLLDDRLRLGFSWFEQDIENLIAYEIVTFGVLSTYLNIDSVTIDEGYEFETMFSVAPWLTLNGSYTHLISSDDSNETDIARTPRETASISVLVRPGSSWFLGLDAVHIGQQFNSSRERNPLESFSRLDVRFEYTLTPEIKVYARVDNLTDKEYQQIRNVGTADRSAYLGLRWSF